MEADVGIEIDLGAYVTDTEKVQLKAEVPAPIRYRADLLTDLVGEVRALGPVSRDELLASLVHTAEANPQSLRAQVETYREARAWQTLRSRHRSGTYIIPAPAPGRPSARSRRT
jgi:hypothetical protein